jgi:Fe-S-cluster containining protein
MPRVFALSVHETYRCRNSGVCCGSDWDVPVEVSVYRSLSEALGARRVEPAGTAHDGGAPLVTDDDLPEEAAAMLARTESGHCVFFDQPTHLCVVHRDLGHAALPATCRHFPRVAVRDARGTHISLTHYCPTAAGLLFEPGRIQIVEDPVAFPSGDYDGLTVGPDALPPLLHPSMLMDMEAYGRWERHMVERCDEASGAPEGILATLARDVALLQDFDPLREQLVDRIEALPASTVSADAPASLDDSLRHVALVTEAVPEELRPPVDADGLAEAYLRFVRPHWNTWHAPLRRYVAAKAFANWTAYQGQGLRAVVTGLEAALALVRVEASRRCRDGSAPLDREVLIEAIRAADFALNHLAVGDDLARAWSREEAP